MKNEEENEYKNIDTDVICVIRKPLLKENQILRQIILDVLDKHGELCSLCEKKGQKLSQCKCMENEECLEHIIELYKGGNYATDL